MQRIGNRMAYDILSGKAICSTLLFDMYENCMFPYPFWAKKADLEHFISSPSLNVKRIKLLPNIEVVKAGVDFAGDKLFYNIAQTTDPLALFDYFLYKRHFFCTHHPFYFDAQCILEEHAKNHGFKARHWVTKGILKNLHANQFYLTDERVCAPQGIFREKLYNIKQTNRPTELLHRLHNIPRGILSGKVLPTLCWEEMYEYQMRHGYTQPLWCHEGQIKIIGLPLKNTAKGIHMIATVEGLKKLVKSYNLGDFIDPLAVHRVSEKNRMAHRSCSDVFRTHYFNSSEVERLVHFKNETGFASRFWIRPADLERAGAICLTGQSGRTVRCSKSEWYNLRQMVNYSKVQKNIYKIMNMTKKKSCTCGVPEPLSIFDDMMREAE